MISWDDIPSLDGLEVDWSFKPETAIDKRAFVRLEIGAVSRLVEVHEIAVRLACVKRNYEGSLVDISAGGLAVNLSAQLEIDLPVKVGLFLGQTKILSRGLVRHVQKASGQYTTGIQFIGLAQESARFLNDLYAAKVLCLAA